LRIPEILREIGVTREEMTRAIASGRTITNARLYPWLDCRIADASGPVVVDGYPRVGNAVAPFNRLVDSLATTKVYAIHLVCPEEVAGVRVRMRSRPDDLTTKLSERNDEYERVQRPLLDALSPQVQIVTVDASATLDKVIVAAMAGLGLVRANRNGGYG
jgi:adenylate kinase family enzyme